MVSLLVNGLRKELVRVPGFLELVDYGDRGNPVILVANIVILVIIVTRATLSTRALSTKRYSPAG